MRTLKIAFVAAAALLSATSLAQANDAAVKYRQANMEIIGGHMHSIVPILKGEVTNKDELLVHAQGLAAVAALTPAAFKEKATGGKSEAKDAIWSKWAEFETDAKAMKTEADKLAQVVASGDTAAIGAQVGALGKTCKGCHDDFKKD
ncbi:c-type cytochrome [Insolitispirillum peregrinum]|uniref:Cytochrome c556 n=1 Tax=Insolitispirillum peregrinum TaxID=80876 RepID=A0A1N7LK44_9PROT|nr:cytochrome c [Insolitispirillum peregrinum]SIS74200.1 Cytochrome c556 [Insolitispirillum peregrinum]